MCRRRVSKQTSWQTAQSTELSAVTMTNFRYRYPKAVSDPKRLFGAYSYQHFVAFDGERECVRVWVCVCVCHEIEQKR